MKMAKTLLSSLSSLMNETLIHQSSDRYGNILVFDDNGIRVLTFGSIYQQSAYYLERPFVHVHDYTRAMMMALAFVEPRHVTLLGLGGGTLLRSAHHYLPACYFHVIERRQTVYEVAKTYFEIPNDLRVQVTIGDAMQHLETLESSSTDVIFSDLYDAQGASPIQAQMEFYRECERALTVSGWLVINCDHSPKDRSPLLRYLNHFFTDIRICGCGFGNFIIFATASPSRNDDETNERVAQMENVLDEPYVAMFRRLTHVSKEELPTQA